MVIIKNIFVLLIYLLINQSYQQAFKPFDPSKDEVNLKYVDMKNLTEYDYSLSFEVFDDDLQESFNEIKEAERKYKLSGCLVLIRNLLEVKDNKVTQTLKRTKFDKGITFNKIYAEMLNNCVNSIEEGIVDKILNEKQIFVEDEPSNDKYLKFESSRFQIIGPIPYLTSEEEKIIEEVNQISKNPDFKEDYSEVLTEFSFIKGRGKYILIGFLFGIILFYLIKLVI